MAAKLKDPGLEMVYGDPAAVKAGRLVIRRGTHRGREYCVVNVRGSWPCAYVDVTGTPYDMCEYVRHPCRGPRPDRMSRLDVPGGVTYNDGWLDGVYEPADASRPYRWFVGWDYAHYGDYTWTDGISSPYGYKLYDGRRDARRWTADEIVQHCRACIDQVAGAV